MLNARQVARIDARVEVSGTEVGVTITATGTPVVATETATIDDARTNSEILSLPLNFRAANTSLISVIALAPGVQVRSGSESFSIAGSRLSQNETSIDGISTLGMRNHDVLVNMFPSSEIVSEIRVSSVILSGPGMAVWSGGIQKQIQLGEQRRFRIMATFQNLANHPNYALPAALISTPASVGRITSTLGTEGAGSRTVELSARFEF